MRLLGIDYGSKYIGLALAEDTFVSPLKTLSYSKDNEVISKISLSYISEIITRESIDKIVIGMPVVDNKETFFAKDVREFTNRLKTCMKIKAPETPKHPKIEFMDESFTSVESKKDVLKSGIAREKRSNDHAFSAAIILKRYLGID